jgi:hypothetical protein
MCREMLDLYPSSNTVQSCLGYIGSLGGPLGSTTSRLKAKAGGSIPSHVAQFPRIMCREMLDMYPSINTVRSCLGYIGSLGGPLGCTTSRS